MLEEGKTYWIITAGTRATCLANLAKDRALFVKEGSPTPFVSWYHNKDNLYPGGAALNCAAGNYYETLADAIKGENIK